MEEKRKQIERIIQECENYEDSSEADDRVKQVADTLRRLLAQERRRYEKSGARVRNPDG